MTPSLIAALCVAAFSTADTPKASAGGAWELRPAGVTSGGGYSAGGAFELEGSIGQPEATTRLVSGSFTLTGGIRLERDAPPPQTGPIFRNGFEEVLP